MLSCLSLVLLIALALIVGGLSLLVPSLRERPAVLMLVLAPAFLLPLAVIVVTAVAYVHMRRDEARQHAMHKHDLEAGHVLVERHRVLEAYRAIRVEHRDRTYFLRLDDGRILYLGAYDPPDDDNPACMSGHPDTELPNTEVEMVRAAVSRSTLSRRFPGRPFAPSRTFELVNDREEPNDGDFVDVPWESIPDHFGGKKKRDAHVSKDE